LGCLGDRSSARAEKGNSDETNVPEWALFVITITGGTKSDEYGNTCVITANSQGVQREIAPSEPSVEPTAEITLGRADDETATETEVAEALYFQTVE